MWSTQTSQLLLPKEQIFDFVGNLNSVNPTSQPEGSTEQERRFLKSRYDRPTQIRNARVSNSVMPSPEEEMDLLTDGLTSVV